jgi:drug/metabolite transporter (DMT)-like permease
VSEPDEPDEPPNPDKPSPPPSPSERPAAPGRLGLLLAFTAVYLIWGSTYMAIRVGVQSIPAFLMAGCRFVTAGAILFTVLRASRVAAPTLAQWRHAAVSGVLMLTAGNGLVTWAEQRVPSNLTALLIAAVPLYVALLDWLRPGGRRPERQALAGIAFGFAGMVLLALPDRHAISAAGGGGAAGFGAGVIGIFVSGLAWAAGSLYARYGRRHPHTGMAGAQQMIVGGLVLLALAFARGESARFTPSAVALKSVLAFGYLTVFGSLVAFSAFSWLVVVSTPARLSTTAYVNPVVAVILGRLLLGERLSTRATLGAALILAAVLVMTVGASSVSLARGLLRGRGRGR